MKIRSATEKDLSKCAELIKIPELTYGEGYHIDKKFMANYLDPNLFLVIEIDFEVIGLIIGEKVKGNGVIVWYLLIRKDKQGKGYGTKLLIEFENRCRKNGINWTVLYGPAENNSSLEFYKKTGYIKGHNLYEFVKEFKND